MSNRSFVLSVVLILAAAMFIGNINTIDSNMITGHQVTPPNPIASSQKFIPFPTHLVLHQGDYIKTTGTGGEIKVLFSSVDESTNTIRFMVGNTQYISTYASQNEDFFGASGRIIIGPDTYTYKYKDGTIFFEDHTNRNRYLQIGDKIIFPKSDDCASDTVFCPRWGILTQITTTYNTGGTTGDIDIAYPFFGQTSQTAFGPYQQAQIVTGGITYEVEVDTQTNPPKLILIDRKFEII